MNQKSFIQFLKKYIVHIVIGIIILLAIDYTIYMLNRNLAYKPVIYLYPTKPQKTLVHLDYQGELTADYPKISNKNTWSVTAFPDGKIINDADNKEYSYLFWEGIPTKPLQENFEHGFVVRGEDIQSFLQEKLAFMGLTPKEYNEFIVFWYPKMKDNPYNIIRFTTDDYTQTAPLNISPKPESMLRVFMVYKASNESVNLPQQKLEPFKRKGFTVVEWGGSCLDESWVSL